MSNNGNLAIPQHPRWIKADSRCRSNHLPITTDAGHPLRRIGVILAGIDYLQGRFYAGTPCSDAHLLWFVTSGSVRGIVLENSYLLKAGDFLIAPARGPHWIELVSSKAIGLWFHLRDVNPWRFLHDQSPVRRTDMLQLLQSLMEQMREETSLSRPNALEMAGHYADLIALFLLRLTGSSNPKEDVWRLRLEELRKDIAEQPELDWTIERLARRTHVSPSYFHRLLRKYLDLRPMEWVMNLRLQRARELLIRTELPLDGIAEQVGYGTAYAFSNAFHRHMGVRPGTFRRSRLMASR